jgi:hypothetical protein
MAKPKTKRSKSKQYMITHSKLESGEYKFKTHRSKSANTILVENFVGESKSGREKKVFLDNLKALSSLY